VLFRSAYAWPGNVRELQNEIQRLLVLSDGAHLDLALLGPHIRQAGLVRALDGEEGKGELRQQVDALETRLLQDALARHDGNLSRTAKELGLSRLGLRQKLTRLGLEPAPRPRGRPALREGP
jgi:two-component system response regulator HupR/HoxA